MSQPIPDHWRMLRGNAYSVKEELKALGARWDRETSRWYVSPEKLREAEDLIEEARRR